MIVKRLWFNVSREWNVGPTFQKYQFTITFTNLYYFKVNRVYLVCLENRHESQIFSESGIALVQAYCLHHVISLWEHEQGCQIWSFSDPLCHHLS